MRNPSTLGYEGAANLLEGFRVAAEPQSRGKGVLVVLNDEINAAREVTKTDALRLQTFQTRGYGVLGVVDSDRVVYYRNVVKRHTQGVRVRRLDDPDAAARGCRDGLSGRERRHHQGDGRSGREGNRDRLGGRRRDQRNAGRGHPLRDREGRVRRDEHPRRRRTHRCRAAHHRRAASRTDGDDTAQQTPQAAGGRNRIAAEDLAPLKARILLMLALTATRDEAEIQRMFVEY